MTEVPATDGKCHQQPGIGAGPSPPPPSILSSDLDYTPKPFLTQVQYLAYTLISILAKYFSPSALDKYYDTDENMQHRTKIVRYPAVAVMDPANDQGVGPHYDAKFLTFVRVFPACVLQAVVWPMIRGSRICDSRSGTRHLPPHSLPERSCKTLGWTYGRPTMSWIVRFSL